MMFVQLFGLLFIVCEILYAQYQIRKVNRVVLSIVGVLAKITVDDVFEDVFTVQQKAHEAEKKDHMLEPFVPSNPKH